MKLIPLSKSKFAQVDDDQWAELSKFKWYYGGGGYACREIGGRKNRKRIWMHRLIASCPAEFECDHIDGNRLNNQKINLRQCDQFGTSQNICIRRTSKSGFRGVSWDEPRKKWVAIITAFKKDHYLGRFDNKLDAAAAYNQMALKLHGSFARLNPI